MFRSMRVGAAVLALLVAAGAAAEAQGGGGRRGGGGGGRGGPGGITMLMQGIEVDASVQEKISALTTKYSEDVAKLRSDLGLPQMGRGGGGGGGGGTPPDSATMAKFQAGNMELTNKLRSDVKALLTPDQQKKFDENLANMPQGRGGRRGGGN